MPALHLDGPNSSRNGDLSHPGTMGHVFTIREDRHGNIWFGMSNGSVYIFSEKGFEER